MGVSPTITETLKSLEFTVNTLRTTSHFPTKATSAEGVASGSAHEASTLPEATSVEDFPMSVDSEVEAAPQAAGGVAVRVSKCLAAFVELCVRGPQLPRKAHGGERTPRDGVWRSASETGVCSVWIEGSCRSTGLDSSFSAEYASVC